MCIRDRVEEIDNANVLLRGEVLSSLASPEGASLCVVTYPDALFEKVMGRRSKMCIRDS